jgi:hypothetical protein
MGSPIAPTVGRVVWFTPSDPGQQNDASQPLAGMVATVRTNDVVNLGVLMQGGSHFAAPDVPYADPPVPYSWRWMPYQLGQAQVTNTPNTTPPTNKAGG